MDVSSPRALNQLAITNQTTDTSTGRADLVAEVGAVDARDVDAAIDAELSHDDITIAAVQALGAASSPPAVIAGMLGLGTLEDLGLAEPLQDGVRAVNDFMTRTRNTLSEQPMFKRPTLSGLAALVGFGQ